MFVDNISESEYMLTKVKRIYAHVSYQPVNDKSSTAEDLDTLVLGVLANLKRETVYFQQMGYRAEKGKIVNVHGRIVHLWEGYKKRKLNIKNLVVYHPAVYAAMVMFSGFVEDETNPFSNPF